jgi:hypothetical protein
MPDRFSENPTTGEVTGLAFLIPDAHIVSSQITHHKGGFRRITIIRRF